MKKYLLPYEQHSKKFPNDYIRKELIGTQYYGVWMIGGVWGTISTNDAKFSSREAAQTALDKILIEEGWTLLSSEEAEKLKLLL